jgi:hypothetical protein
MQRARFLLAVPVACALACGDATQPASVPLPDVPLILTSVQAIPDTGVAYTVCLPAAGYTNIDFDPPGGGGHFDTLHVVHLDAEDDTVTRCGDLTFAD